MKKALSYLLPLLVAFVALIPPIRFRIPAPTEHWPLMVACAGFLGIRTLFIKVNPIVKIAAGLAFLSCFFSSIPYISFNTYVVIVAHIYLYIGLTRMDSWRPMFATFKTLLIYNAFLICMQVIGQDQMFNWSLDSTVCFGITGHHMHMGSYSVILAAFLGILSPLYLAFPIVVAFFCNSAWALMCAGSGLLVYASARKKRALVGIGVLIVAGFFVFAIQEGKIQENLAHSGRMEVWKESLELTNEKPLTGWGPGTFKGAFPSLSQAIFDRRSRPYEHAHNDYVQFAFEFGYPITAAAAAALIAGFVMIALNMVVHFPTRLAELCPMILAFLAYCEVSIYGKPKN